MDSLTPQVFRVVRALPLLLPDSFNIAATTSLTIWNILLTLDEERKFIWSSNVTFLKILYFVVRYLALLLFCGITLGFFLNTKLDWCTNIIWFATICGSIVTACSNILLIQRVYAFYERSSYIFWIFYAVYVLSEISIVVILISGLPDFRAAKDNLPSPIPELFGRCIFETYPPIFAYGWFPKFSFEAIAFVCVVSRFVRLKYVAWKTGISNPQLYHVFLRDGTWTFFVLFLSCLSTAILFHAHSAAAISFGLWTFALSSVCSTRMILNLHHAAKKTQYSTSFSQQRTPRIVIA